MVPAQPGWQALFLGSDGDSAPGWTAEPVIAWGIFQVTDVSDGRTRVSREIIGVAVLEAPEPVTAVRNFWFYLAPGAPEPTPQETQIAREAASEYQRQGAG
jgi:hypothetical protein